MNDKRPCLFTYTKFQAGNNPGPLKEPKGENVMFSLINTTYHWHTWHSCDLVMVQIRSQAGAEEMEGTKLAEGIAAIFPYQRYGREWPRTGKNLVKLVNGTHSSIGKTGLPFQKFHSFRKFFSGTNQKSMFHL